jgi:surface protein
VKGDTSLTELDLSGWKTDNVDLANSMFEGATNLTTVGDLSGWRLNNATTTADMFNGAAALNGLGKLDNWGLGKDTNMSGMFQGTSSLTDIGDIHSWDVSNVQRMDNMFNGTAISNFNISGWHFNSSMATNYGKDDDGYTIYGSSGMFANLQKPTEITANHLGGDVSKFSAADFYSGNQPLIVISDTLSTSMNTQDDHGGGYGHEPNIVTYVKLEINGNGTASQQQDFVFDSQEDLDKYLDNLTTGKNYKTAAEETASDPDMDIPDDAVLPLLPTKGATIPTDLDKIAGTYVIGYAINYQFVDDDENQHPVGGDPITIKGNMGQTIDLSRQFNLPAGYVLDDKIQDNTIPSGSYTFDQENLDQLLNSKILAPNYSPSSHNSIPINLHLKHKTMNVPHDNPVKPGDKTPIGKEIKKGAYESDLNQTITRTINVTEPGQATTTTTQTATIYRDATVDEVTGEVKAHTPWSTDTTDWKAVDVPSYTGYTAAIKQIVTNSDGTTTETTVDSIPDVVVDGTTKSTTINVTYTANDQSITYNFVDDDEKVEGQPKPVSSITESGKVDQTINFTLTVPANYQLATGQTLPTSHKFTAENNNPVTIHLVHKTEDVSDTDPQAKETRTLTVNYINASNGQPMQNLTPAQLQVFYKRSAIKDLVTGKVTYGNWQWDKSQGDKDTPGYHKLSGNWTLPQEWNPVKVDTPDVAGFTNFTTGDWEKNKDGGVSAKLVPANEFTFPTYGGTSTTITGSNSTAYTPAAPVYEATATHTVYYVPVQEEGRVITEHYKKYNADGSYEDANVVEMPDGTKQSYAQIKVWYQKKANTFATHGSTDPSKWTILYDGWEWDKNAGDQDTPGFTVVSGGYSFNNKKSGQGLWCLPSGGTWSVVAPTIDGYTAVIQGENPYNTSTTLGGPNGNGDGFKNATDGTWYWRNDLTTFYVPTSMLSKTITRTINVQDPTTGKFTAVI